LVLDNRTGIKEQSRVGKTVMEDNARNYNYQVDNYPKNGQYIISKTYLVSLKDNENPVHCGNQ
jgi:hypothetical protein